ncbi:MAG: 30S ribosomal protein S18 [Planctomycetota bacterium]
MAFGKNPKFRRFGTGTRVRPEEELDYKNVGYIGTFLSHQARIISRKRSGFSGADQKKLKLAIKRARFLALLPYTA